MDQEVKSLKSQSEKTAAEMSRKAASFDQEQEKLAKMVEERDKKINELKWSE